MKCGKHDLIAVGAVVRGDVTLGDDVGVWYNAVIRGDFNSIAVGSRTNIQDNCVLHASPTAPLAVGEGVTIGHGAIVHGCTIGDNTLIGMGSIVMNGAVIGANSIIGSGTLITGGTVIPEGSVVVGNPARILRTASEVDIRHNRASADFYVKQIDRMKDDNTLLQEQQGEERGG